MRLLRLLPLAAMLILLGLGAGFLVAQAQEHPDDAEGPPPKPSWEPPVITGTITGTTTFTATATVSPTVSGLECVVRPKKFAGDAVKCQLSATDGTVTVTLTVTPTDDLHGRSLNFQVFLRADDEERVIAPPLRVRLFNDSTGGAAEDRGKPDEDNDLGPADRGPGRGTDHRPEDRPGKGDEHRANPGPPGSAGDHGRSGGRRGGR